MRLGLIGCGSIGSAVARAVSAGKIGGVRLVGIADVAGSEAAEKTAAAAECPFVTDIRALLVLRPDLILECASQEVVRSSAVAILEAGVDLMVVSVGALADEALLSRLTAAAQLRGLRLYIPSGAVGGIDIIRGAAAGGLEECRLTTTKSPRALAGVAYVMEHGIDLEGIREATVVYEGPASQAVRLFPQNINVAATVSLAGIGLERTTVRIVADPAATRNMHEVFMRGAFGEATVRLANLPSPVNPKSSYLASLSVIAALQRINQSFQLGT